MIGPEPRQNAVRTFVNDANTLRISIVRRSDGLFEIIRDQLSQDHDGDYYWSIMGNATPGLFGSADAAERQMLCDYRDLTRTP